MTCTIPCICYPPAPSIQKKGSSPATAGQKAGRLPELESISRDRGYLVTSQYSAPHIRKDAQTPSRIRLPKSAQLSTQKCPLELLETIDNQVEVARTHKRMRTQYTTYMHQNNPPLRPKLQVFPAKVMLHNSQIKVPSPGNAPALSNRPSKNRPSNRHQTPQHLPMQPQLSAPTPECSMHRRPPRNQHDQKV